jgi:hypothetical protein
MHMLRVQNEHLKNGKTDACTEHTRKELLKIRLSIRVRNFAALNEPLNITKNYFNP